VLCSSELPADVSKVGFISQDLQAKYTFQGIVPRGRYPEVVVVDVGSSNTKGAYQEKPGNPPTIATFNIALGTKTYAQEINQARGDGAFRVTAEVMRKEKLIPLISEPVQQHPGLQTTSRLYLVGGFCWAMTTLLHPEAIDAPWVTLTKDEIKTFCDHAMSNPRQILNPGLEKVDAKVLDKAKDEISRVGKVFTEDQMMAGAQILITFLDRIHYQEKKAIFFSRKGIYAWPEGYVVEKIGAEK
jgi:hypothetical protein